MRQLRAILSTAVIMLALAIGSLLSPCPVTPSQQSAYDSPHHPSTSPWIQDLDYLANQLPKRHKNLFFKISPEEFTRNVNELRHDIPNLTDYEVVVSMMAIVASIGDSHTMLNAHFSGIFHQLPVTIEWFSDGLYVMKAPPSYADIVGKRIVSINDKSVEETASMIKPVVPHENDAQFKNRAPQYLTVPEVLAALNITDSPDSVPFSVESVGTAFIRPQTIGPDSNWVSVFDDMSCSPPLYLQNQDQHYWFTYLTEALAVYAQYNACNEMKELAFASFTDDLFNFVDSHVVNKFIFDIRLNGGGNSSIARPVIDDVKRRKSINKEGSLFVIIGRKTFSSAILNALEFKHETNAIFVGESTGGKPNHYGEVRFLTLPNSGIIVTYSTKYFENSSEDTPSLYPDINVERSFSDVVTCKDPALDAILDYE